VCLWRYFFCSQRTAKAHAGIKLETPSGRLMPNIRRRLAVLTLQQYNAAIKKKPDEDSN